MIYTISAGISDVPRRWRCADCGEECVSRDIDGLNRLRETHQCPPVKMRPDPIMAGRDYFGRTR